MLRTHTAREGQLARPVKLTFQFSSSFGGASVTLYQRLFICHKGEIWRALRARATGAASLCEAGTQDLGGAKQNGRARDPILLCHFHSPSKMSRRRASGAPIECLRARRALRAHVGVSMRPPNYEELLTARRIGTQGDGGAKRRPI